MATSEKRNTAERNFLKATKAPQGRGREKTEQEEATRVNGEKTARLRSLRLARDASDKEAAHGKLRKAAKLK